MLPPTLFIILLVHPYNFPGSPADHQSSDIIYKVSFNSQIYVKGKDKKGVLGRFLQDLFHSLDAIERLINPLLLSLTQIIPSNRGALCFAATTTDRFFDRILCLRIEALGDEMTASQRSMEKLKELDAGSEEQGQRPEKELGITDSPKMGDDDPDWSQKNSGPKLIVS